MASSSWCSIGSVRGRHGAAHSQTTEQLAVDCVIANVGYRPNRTLYEELQVHECYASQGPMNLAVALLGESSPDCLQHRVQSAAALRNPSPAFSSSALRAMARSRFLIRKGSSRSRRVRVIALDGKTKLEDEDRESKIQKSKSKISSLPPPPWIELTDLDELWFQVSGTLCNLRCTHCFISCSPQNDSFGFCR